MGKELETENCKSNGELNEQTPKGKNIKKIVIIVVITIAIIAAGIMAWLELYKKPHDAAVVVYNEAVGIIEGKNQELESEIKQAKDVLDSGEEPYDPQTLEDSTVAIAKAQNDEIDLPEEMPKKTQEILDAAASLDVNVDYSSDIKMLKDVTAALEKSIQQLKQVTCPKELFVIERLGNIEEVTGIEAVTEDNDPNGRLNKPGGYTACVYFTSSNVNPARVFGKGIVGKGNAGGGTVEVYASVKDAETRNNYLGAFDGMGILSSGTHYVVGTCVIRTSDALTATQQKNLEAAVIEALIEVK